MTVAARPIEPCPRPSKCPVAVTELVTRCTDDPDSLPVATLAEGEPWVRIYWSVDGHAEPNPGVGSTRFAPFPGAGAAADIMVPTMYVARTLRAALLETVFHTAEPTARASAATTRLPSVLTGNDLLGRLHARLALPRSLRLVDLRNPALSGLGLVRESVVSSSALHYSCTRRIAQAICNAAPADGGFDGILWHSRQSEVAASYLATPERARRAVARPPASGGAADDEVVVLFCHRVEGGRAGGWRLVEAPDSSGSLFEGSGERAVQELAADLAIVLDPSIDGT
ncbi:hypothetical protein JCM18899A_11610 [Nocardioides sp. AN3]